MFMVPTGILFLWLSGIWFYGLIVAGIWLLWRWYERSCLFDPAVGHRVFHPILGANHNTTLFVLGLALLLLPLIGGVILTPILRALCRKDPGDRTSRTAFPGARDAVTDVERPDGTHIAVECHGPADGPQIVLSHGWGTNRTEWEYLRRDLAQRGFRLVTWDMPGLGDSDVRADRSFALTSLAEDLNLVVQAVSGDRPVVLCGHSIGGMTTLTYCRDYRESLNSRVAGLALVNTTYTDPVKTVAGSGIMAPLEKPILVPLQYLAIALSPLLRIANIIGYANGSAHLFSLLSGFAGTQSWEELDFSTRFTLSAPPGVVARGMLGMMRYDATPVLPTIPVPTLIVTGDKDVCCRKEASERMTREIPNARLEVFSPSNHMGLMEHRGRFADQLAEFAEQCLQRRPAADSVTAAEVAAVR